MALQTIIPPSMGVVACSGSQIVRRLSEFWPRNTLSVCSPARTDHQSLGRFLQVGNSAGLCPQQHGAESPRWARTAQSLSQREEAFCWHLVGLYREGWWVRVLHNCTNHTKFIFYFFLLRNTPVNSPGPTALNHL